MLPMALSHHEIEPACKGHKIGKEGGGRPLQLDYGRGKKKGREEVGRIKMRGILARS